MSDDDVRDVPRCRCLLFGPCDVPVCSASGEAMLCHECWQAPDHKAANVMTVKRLPKRSLS